jgi:hypothetical protein
MKERIYRDDLIVTQKYRRFTRVCATAWRRYRRTSIPRTLSEFRLPRASPIWIHGSTRCLNATSVQCERRFGLAVSLVAVGPMQIACVSV